MNTPVALIIFNRPDVTARVAEVIAKARPPKIFVRRRWAAFRRTLNKLRKACASAVPEPARMFVRNLRSHP